MNIAVNDAKGNIFAQFVAWVAKGWEGASEAAMIEAMDPATIRAIAGDCGIQPDQLIELAKAGPHAADEMPQMMRSLGIDPMEVETRFRDLYRSMLIECAHCSSKGKCRVDIAHDMTRDRFAGYCRNADHMVTLKATPAVLAD